MCSQFHKQIMNYYNMFEKIQKLESLWPLKILNTLREEGMCEACVETEVWGTKSGKYHRLITQ